MSNPWLKSFEDCVKATRARYDKRVWGLFIHGLSESLDALIRALLWELGYKRKKYRRHGVHLISSLPIWSEFDREIRVGMTFIHNGRGRHYVDKVEEYGEATFLEALDYLETFKELVYSLEEWFVDRKPELKPFMEEVKEKAKEILELS